MPLLPQEYSFKVQVPGKGGKETLTVGKAELDMARYVSFENAAQNALVPITFKVGTTTTGYLKLVITSQMLKGEVGEDGMTEVSGMTGLTSVVHEVPDQDLSGGGRSCMHCSSRRCTCCQAQGCADCGPGWPGMHIVVYCNCLAEQLLQCTLVAQAPRLLHAAAAAPVTTHITSTTPRQRISGKLHTHAHTNLPFCGVHRRLRG